VKKDEKLTARVPIREITLLGDLSTPSCRHKVVLQVDFFQPEARTCGCFDRVEPNRQLATPTPLVE
jgi:hypothetical protein